MQFFNEALCNTITNSLIQWMNSFTLDEAFFIFDPAESEKWEYLAEMKN